MSEPKINRIPIMMSDAEVKAIDDWRFANRIATRSEAVRRLCHLGLGLEEKIRPIDDQIGKVLNQLEKMNSAYDSALKKHPLIGMEDAADRIIAIEERADLMKELSALLEIAGDIAAISGIFSGDSDNLTIDLPEAKQRAFELIENLRREARELREAKPKKAPI